jgi:hypothetical protein
VNSGQRKIPQEFSDALDGDPLHTIHQTGPTSWSPVNRTVPSLGASCKSVKSLLPEVDYS